MNYIQVQIKDTNVEQNELLINAAVGRPANSPIFCPLFSKLRHKENDTLVE